MCLGSTELTADVEVMISFGEQSNPNPKLYEFRVHNNNGLDLTLDGYSTNYRFTDGQFNATSLSFRRTNGNTVSNFTGDLKLGLTKARSASTLTQTKRSGYERNITVTTPDAVVGELVTDLGEDGTLRGIFVADERSVR